MLDKQHRNEEPGPLRAYGSPDEIIESIQRIRDRLVDLIAGAGADPAKTRSTARWLGLNPNTIWPVARMINADDILTAAGDIPTLKQIEVLCKACRKKGAPDADIEAVRDAMANYERVVEISAGDRESFADMLNGLTYDDVSSRQEGVRKMAFRAQSSLWGVRAGVTFKTVIHVPSDSEPNWIDTVRLGGLVNLRRLRPVPWSLHRMVTYNDNGTALSIKKTPLDSNIADPQALPVLREFCSDPLPEITGVESEAGVRFDIAPGMIGNAGAIDYVFGDILRSLTDKFNHEGDRHISAVLELQTPAEMVLFDLFLHRDLPFPTMPEVLHLDRLNAFHDYSTNIEEWKRLPLSAQVKPLAPGAAGCATPHYPGYRKLLDYTFDTIGVSPLEFRGYRFLMKYPTIPSSLVLRVPKLTPPEE